MSANKLKLKSKDSEVNKNIFDLKDNQPMTKKAVISQNVLKKIS